MTTDKAANSSLVIIAAEYKTAFIANKVSH
jgi:hypothetical protein